MYPFSAAHVLNECLRLQSVLFAGISIVAEALSSWIVRGRKGGQRKPRLPEVKSQKQRVPAAAKSQVPGATATLRVLLPKQLAILLKWMKGS